MFLEIDASGTIIHSFHDPKGAVINGGLGEAYQINNTVYLGHFGHPYVGVIDVNDLYNNL